MTAPYPPGEADLEIGHVLFMDVVGFSKLLVDEQTERSNRLNRIVRNTEAFRSAEAADKLIRLPTGDGMVLVFFTSPEAPVRCAMEIAKALKGVSDLGLRQGVHSGPVNKVIDVNDRSNVAGGGINMAQRVMDCGDAGHILLSKRVADDLGQYGRWRPHLHDLGQVEVKHGVRLELVNLITDEVGNPAIPEKFAHAKLAHDAATVATAQQKTQRVESLAVKPLDNFSGDATKNYFADGMTDELITKLSQIGALTRVISRSAMMKYKQSPKSASEIARELNVQVVVEGSVVLAGDQARISVQLIEGATDHTLWAESYTRDVANIVNLQNEVALAIANAVALTLTPKEKARLAADRTVNPQAYDCYLRGKGYYGAGKAAADSTIDMLEKSVALDATFAEAYAELSIAYSSKGYFLEGREKLWEVKAEEAVAKALTLDPELPAAHMARARLLWRPSSGFQHERAIAEVHGVLAVAPNLGDAHLFLAGIYFHVGLIDEALQRFRRAEEVNPGNPAFKFTIGLMALLRGQYDDAYTMMAANPEGMVRSYVETTIASALFYSGRTSEAKSRIEAAKAQFKDDGGILTSMQALFHALDGDRTLVEAKIAEATRIGEGFGHYHHTTLVFAWAYTVLEDIDLALKWLRYTVENGYPSLPWLERDPAFTSLRTDPRFVALLDTLRPGFARYRALAASLTASGR